MDAIDELTQINQKQQQSQVAADRHTESQLSSIAVQETIIRALQTAIEYLDGRVGRAEIVNLPDNIGTPDVVHVVHALHDLHETLRTHENTDVGPIVDVMQHVLEELRKMPKDLPEMPEQQFVDYTDKFDKLESALGEIQTAVKAQDLHVDAPNVHVAAPEVHVDAPDLSALQSGQKEVVNAVKGIKVPEPASMKKVEGLLGKVYTVLDEILNNLPGGAGGGGGLATPYQNGNGLPAFPELDNEGQIPVTLESAYDFIDFADQTTNGSPQTITFKHGGSSGNVVKTLALTYDANDNITSITRT